MKNGMQWCKVHHEARTDPKLKILSLAERGVWTNLLLFASEQQQRGTFNASNRYILALECSEGDEEILNSTIEKLELVCHLITNDEGQSFTFRTWTERQYDKPSDTPEATRERKEKSRHAVSRDVTCNHAIEEDPEEDPDPEKTNHQIKTTKTQDKDKSLRAQQAPLARQISDITHIPAAAVLPIIIEYAAKLQAKGVDIALFVETSYNTFLSKNGPDAPMFPNTLREWLKREARGDDRTDPPPPKAKYKRLTPTTPNGHKPQSRDGPASTSSKTMTRIRNIA